uniref:KIB1-4 beta-propeller domain-containing protein n=1 Tax=Brassica oleracea TaxID=3712 RepID=A0A3P6CX77_BRAOL|nr:unnamed protein product [Brassica oleracea]
MPDWSLLPEELLNIISENVEDCFDIVHARSVSNFWRSTFSFPCMLRRPSYSLPSFANFPSKSKGLCTLEKIPLFLFRVQTPPPASASEYFLGGIGRDESEDLTELPSPLQCSVKVKIPGSDPTLMNMRDGQIFPLGHQYRISCDSKDYRSLAFLPLHKEGREEFIVLLSFSRIFLALRSSEMKWKLVMGFKAPSSENIVTFRGMFYVTIRASMTTICTFSIDPFSLHLSHVLPLNHVGSLIYLVPCGNDEELFMVKKFISYSNVSDFSRFTCRVSRPHEETGQWLEVSDLGDRVLFIRQQGNVSCSAKELPDGCGVSGNSILFTNELDNGTYVYKYGVDTGREEDDINCWRFSGENRVTILSTSPVVNFRVEH